MSTPTYGPAVPTSHFISAEVNATSRQNGGMAPIDTWAPNGIRSIIPAGLGYARSEAFYSPLGDPGRKITNGDTFTWSGTFVADLGPARRLPQFHILWQLHAGTPEADIPARLVSGSNGTGIGGRDYTGGGSGTGWFHRLVDEPRGDVIEHHISVSMSMSDAPAGGHVLVEWDGATAWEGDMQTWPDADLGVTEMIVRAGIYRGPEGQPAPRAQSNTWRDVTFAISRD